jgi:hypothetical protein
MSVILPPPPPSTQGQQSRETFLSYVRKKFENADPISKKRFADKFEDVNPETGEPILLTEQEQEQSYFIDEDSKECGLTKAEYEFLLEDIDNAIAEANRKYGCGEPGYIDKHGDYHPFPAGKPVKSKHRKLSPEDVAIARGIIKINRPIEEEEL